MKKLAFVFLILFLAAAFSAYAQEDLSFLSEEEKLWLVENGSEIRLAPERNYPPFIFVENGTVQGLSFDYVRAIENKLGITFKIIDSANLATHMESLKAGQAEIITSLKETPERAEFLHFTKPYVEVPAVILVRDDFDRDLTIEDLDEKVTVAVGDGYGAHEYLESLGQGINLAPKPDDLAGLRALSSGEVDALVMDLVSANYFIEENDIINLNISENTGYFYDLSLASRNDLPILASILEKALEQVTPNEREVINSRWAEISSNTGRDSGGSRDYVWYSIAVILAALLIGLFLKKGKYKIKDISENIAEEESAPEIVSESQDVILSETKGDKEFNKEQ